MAKHKRGTMKDGCQPIVFVVMLNDADFNDAKQVFAHTSILKCFLFCGKKPSIRKTGRYEVQVWRQREGWTGSYLWNIGTKEWELQS